MTLTRGSFTYASGEEYHGEWKEGQMSIFLISVKFVQELTIFSDTLCSVYLASFSRAWKPGLDHILQAH